MIYIFFIIFISINIIIKMKATKRQIAEVTETANLMNFSVEKALYTLSNCSLNIYKIIGSKGVVESSIRANSKFFVNTLALAKIADKEDCTISELMTNEEKIINH